VIARHNVRTSEGTGLVRGLLALFGAVAIAGAGIVVWNAGALGGLRGVGYEAPAGMALLGPWMAAPTARLESCPISHPSCGPELHLAAGVNVKRLQIPVESLDERAVTPRALAASGYGLTRAPAPSL